MPIAASAARRLGALVRVGEIFDLSSCDALGIPIFGIIVRYNLENAKLAGPRLSFFFGVVAPWLVTMFCYQVSASSSAHPAAWRPQSLVP